MLPVFESIKNIKTVGRAGAVASKYSPQILTGVGIGAVVVSTVLVAKATLRLEDVVDKHEERVANVNEKKASMNADEYTSTHHKRDMTKVYFQTAGDLTKLYGLPVTLGVTGIACIVGGQGIQYKRTVGAVAAYKTLEESFDRYRARVVEEFGLDKDEEFRKTYTVQEETDAEGNTKVTVDKLEERDYVFFHNKDNPNWKNTAPDYNLMFVKAQETYANQLLSTRGHVLLNDVLDSLGLPRTHEGAVVGWVLTQEGPNFIDFGIRDLQGTHSRVLGLHDEEAPSIMLDFNVQGIIWDKF
ncbi:hypothetical protein SEA_SLOOPYJOE_52 [Arthrobacter phage Sloopyjoe]|nr:hypothetical protein PBI_STAYER_52 [Arthrobacter phage Stayer]QFG10196.1 hypothetical protein PBI_EGAD_52 [Arthrobacter phage Egad]QFG11766.1 hypothetical protein PBI_SALK_52 [Arthrobacter phage Salk]QFG12648.1 hypothetical protein PBI_MICHELLE_52 [Arthrobacter phage Michelle]QFG14421.1 hypothetical protein PBI_STARLORD_52 [Arthrobacter phage StarLord]UVT31130.1 hypothetical protein PBI_LINDA_52 [Arthrobacter phage Linda]WAB09468.1 hypothetical protein SEA_SLOOPYJOE_52 [Arthrobacter phage 